MISWGGGNEDSGVRLAAKAVQVPQKKWLTQVIINFILGSISVCVLCNGSEVLHEAIRVKPRRKAQPSYVAAAGFRMDPGGGATPHGAGGPDGLGCGSEKQRILFRRRSQTAPAADGASAEANRTTKETPMLGTILLVLLILFVLGALPTWPHSRSWGYGPSGGLGLCLVILVVLMVTQRI